MSAVRALLIAFSSLDSDKLAFRARCHSLGIPAVPSKTISVDEITGGTLPACIKGLSFPGVLKPREGCRSFAPALAESTVVYPKIAVTPEATA